jgi:flagellar biosynthetic protein FlhB
MAESLGDKTEAPTAKRRQEARDQGQIAKSADLSSAALLVGGMYLLKWFGLNIVQALHGVVRFMLSGPSLADLDAAHVRGQILQVIGMVGWSLAPVLGGAALIVILANLAQVGLVLNITRLQPNFGALNPLRGLGRLFSGGQGAVKLLMDLAKVTLVGLVAYSAIGDRLVSIISAQQLSFLSIFSLGADIIFSIAIRVGFLLLVLAIIDYAYQRHRIEKELMMSKQDVKEEMRSMEGDPRIKQRRRQVAIQRAMQKLKKEVPKADVIVTNPTHFAVALKYDDKAMRAPRLIAKGADFMAQRIRELAAGAGVPIVERAPLARAIYRMVDVGEEIPEEFYSAVAEILAYVYELNGKVRRRAAV